LFGCGVRSAAAVDAQGLSAAVAVVSRGAKTMTECVVLLIGVVICFACAAYIAIEAEFNRFAERMRNDISESMRDAEGES
jgi:hypothetical protein